MLDPNQFTALATFWSDKANAISFYYGPPQPENLAHKKTILTAKEQARELLRAAHDRPDLRGIFERLVARVEDLRIADPAGLAIFASPEPETWVEFDLPYHVESQSQVGNAFALAPLAPLAAELPRYFVLLLDRSVTRLLFLSGSQLTERTREFGEERVPVRETGTSRKKSDERSKDDETFHHLRDVGNRLFRLLEQGAADFVYVGCRTELWSEIEKAMPDGVVQKTLGHFHCDPGLVTLPEVSALVMPLIDERVARELQTLADEIRGAAAGGRKGVVGPAEVANALEMGETETILVAPHPPAPATVCTSCEHIAMGTAAVCELCNNPNRVYPDLAEILARRGGRGTFRLQLVPHGMLDPEAKGFSALLRFRADQQDTGSPDALVA